MKVIVPDYYNEFKCIADRCKHTCCKGWEVEIDDDSMARYEGYPDIKDKVEQGEDNHFRLLPGEICPFLRADGLCEMIVKYGEDMICQTCRDHPRFRNYWSDRIEMGIGLVCEEAARLILSKETPMKLVVLPGTEDGVAEDIMSDDMLVDNRARLPEDEEWLMGIRDDMIARAIDMEKVPLMARLREYLIYRHISDALYDDRLEERIGFIDSFMDLVKTRWEASDGSFESLVDIVRQYSYDIEYDEDEKEKYLG